VRTTKTLLDVDEELLAEATAALGTSTNNDTVNEVLRLVVETTRERRRRALEDLQRIADEGGIDFDRIAEVDSETVGRVVPQLREQRLTSGGLPYEGDD
jgi:Arc/MetJ family transcription regulator